MRILHVLNHSGRLNGHVHAAVDLACAQAAAGHDVGVCSAEGDFDDLLRKDGVTVYRADLVRSAGMILTPFAMARILLRSRAEIVHAHMVTSALLTWPACRAFGRPLVTTVHNEFSRSSRLMGIADRVIAVSEAVRRSMEARGIDPNRLHTVLNGTIGAARLRTLDSSAIELPSPSIVFVGGLHPRKGVEDLLDAFRGVLHHHPRATLTIVGEGPHGAAYRSRAAPFGKAVRFVGAQVDPQRFMRGADVFVLPSHADPAPLVIAEAREAGCAIVASNVDGIPELLEHGQAGVLVRPRAPDHLARAIIALFDDPARLRELRRASQFNLDNLRIERVAEATLAIYRDAAKRRPHRGPTLRTAVPPASSPGP